MDRMTSTALSLSPSTPVTVRPHNIAAVGPARWTISVAAPAERSTPSLRPRRRPPTACTAPSCTPRR
eukprot:2814940-Pyramimonas_sp.AAC.1